MVHVFNISPPPPHRSLVWFISRLPRDLQSSWTLSSNFGPDATRTGLLSHSVGTADTFIRREYTHLCTGTQIDVTVDGRNRRLSRFAQNNSSHYISIATCTWKHAVSKHQQQYRGFHALARTPAVKMLLTIYIYIYGCLLPTGAGDPGSQCCWAKDQCFNFTFSRRHARVRHFRSKHRIAMETLRFPPCWSTMQYNQVNLLSRPTEQYFVFFCTRSKHGARSLSWTAYYHTIFIRK